MSSGTWTPDEGKERAGLYNWFLSLATSRITGTKKGIVGIPIKADWEPDNQLVICEDASQITSTFGTGETVYLAVRAAMAGKQYKPYRIVLYRLAAASAAPAVVTVSEVLKLVAKHKGVRGNNFKVSISDNIIDERSKDICIYEGSTMIKKYTVLPDNITAAIDKINSDITSLVSAIKIKDGELENISATAFTGGDSGSEITSEEYVNAMSAFESMQIINTIALDGISDAAIIAMLKSWHKRVWDAGNMVQICIGGSNQDDKDPNIGNARSKACDDYGIINVIVGGVDKAGNIYSSSEMAAQFAGAIAALPLNSALTYKELEDIVDITLNLSDTEIAAATSAGSLVMFKDIDPKTFETTVKVERGINTFTSYSTDKSKKFRKIKAISTMSAMNYDIGRYAMQNVIGELDNNGDGRATMISGIKKYLETLVAAHVISQDILVDLSESLTLDGDVVYLETKALTIDKIEQIFNKIFL